MGLPNQALKSLVSQFQGNVLSTIPLEVESGGVVSGAGATDVIALHTVTSNYKVTMDSLIVTPGDADDIFKLYRNGAVILQFVPGAAAVGTSKQVFPEGGGKEFDEGETWKITVTSVAGGGTCYANVSGRQELKRQMLYSPLIA
jgi:hypothetical protein